MKKILVLGDSVAWGIGDSEALGWAGRIRQHLESSKSSWQVFNFAFTEEDFSSLFKVASVYLQNIQPDLVLLAIGQSDLPANQIFDAVETARWREQFTNLLLDIKSKQPKLIVLGMTEVKPKNDFGWSPQLISEGNGILQEITKQNKTAWLDLTVGLSAREFNHNGIYPTKSGYQKLFPVISNYIGTRYPEFLVVSENKNSKVELSEKTNPAEVGECLLPEIIAKYSAGPDTGVFTDGSAIPNPGPGGYGAVFVQGGKIIWEIHGEDTQTTNNRMEFLAVIEALRKFPPEAEAIIYSDSNLVVQTLNSWAKTWMKNGWTRKSKDPISNLDLVQEAYRLFEERPKITITWTAGHAGWRWNEYADGLSTLWRRD